MSLIVNGRSASLKETNILVSEYGEVITSSSSGLGIPMQFFVTQAGNGTGDYHITGDYSAAPVDYYYEATSKYDIYNILISVSDDKSFNQLDYGGLSLGTITNGIKFFVRPPGGSDIPLLSGVGVIANYQWLTLSPNVFLTTFAGLEQSLSIVFDIEASYGIPLTLVPGARIIARVNDNFTGLYDQTIGLRGLFYFPT